MRAGPIIAVFGALCVVAACAPQVPDSGFAGFENSEDAVTARALARNGGAGYGVPITPPPVISEERLPGDPGMTARIDAVPRDSDGSADIAAEAMAALEATARNSGVAPVEASPANPAPVPVAAPGENTGAVPVPSAPPRAVRRSGAAEANVVAYALSTSHDRGTRLYKRQGINLAARAHRKCAGYASADLAQIDFLDHGGPERDRIGLDPDGDGFACAWNPSPFRRAAQG